MRRRSNPSVALVALLFFAVPTVIIAQDQTEIDDEVIAKIQKALPNESPAPPRSERKVLVFTKTNGFRHGSIPVAVKSLTMLGQKTGAYTVVHSEDDAMFEPEKLKQFDAVFMINTTGQLFRPKKMPEDEQEKKQVLAREERLKKSLIEFVESGKGLAGTHSATDTYKNWPEFNDMMGGAFVSHPWHTKVPVRLLDTSHPLNKVFSGEGFTITDEIYQFRDDTAKGENRRMLLSLDPAWDQLKKGTRADKFYPISWIDTYGKGRIFYCSLGHRDEIYYHPAILEHYLAGFQFALGDLEADATPLDDASTSNKGN